MDDYMAAVAELYINYVMPDGGDLFEYLIKKYVWTGSGADANKEGNGTQEPVVESVNDADVNYHIWQVRDANGNVIYLKEESTPGTIVEGLSSEDTIFMEGYSY